MQINNVITTLVKRKLFQSNKPFASLADDMHIHTTLIESNGSVPVNRVVKDHYEESK